MSAFSIFTSKKRRPQKPVPTIEEYYLRLARRTTVIKFIIIMFLAGFTLFSFSYYKEELTIENFRYMLKFINFGTSTNTNPDSAVYYDKDASNKGEVLRGDLAVINKNGFFVYGFNGSKVYSRLYKYDHPKMVTNSKNIIACDLGGYEVQIYGTNQLTQTISYKYPVLGLAASENGPFAVISSEKSYRSALFIYDEHFRVIYKYFSGDKYIDFVSVSENGKEALALLHYPKEGSIITLLMRFSVDSEQPVFQYEFIDEMPLGVNFMSDNSYCVMTSDAIRFFTPDNKLRKESFFGEKSLLGYEFNRNYAIITYDASGLSSGMDVEVFRKDGSIVTSKSFASSVLDKKINGDKLYVLTHGSITTIDLTGKEPDRSDTVDTDFRQIIFNEQKVILLSDSRAVFFSTESKSENSQ
jgi:hypothetical protein